MNTHSLEITAVEPEGVLEFPKVNEPLPQHPFTLGFISPKGAGKSTVIVNFLIKPEFYKGYYNNIYIFSPTIAADPKFALLLRTKGVRTENKWLKRFMRKQKQKEDRDKNRVLNKHCPVCQDIYNRPFCVCSDSDEDETIPGGEEKFDTRIPKENVYTTFSEAVLQRIRDNQNDVVEYLETHGHEDDAPMRIDRICIIFDDPVGTPLFSDSKETVFKKINTGHRHGSFDLITVSQGYKEIPKTVRTNFSAMIFFKIANESEINSIYEENAAGMTKEEWYEAYRYATAERYCFYYINYQNPYRNAEGDPLVMRNFTDRIEYTTDDNVLLKHPDHREVSRRDRLLSQENHLQTTYPASRSQAPSRSEPRLSKQNRQRT